MNTLSITSYFTTAFPTSPTALRIAAAFGIPLDAAGHKRFTILDNLHLTIAPGRIILITGQSGCGKSTLLNILTRLIRPATHLNRIRTHKNKILPDHFNLPLEKTLHYLSLAGLADAFLFLRTPPQLSDGQLYRFKLALALARRPKTILADEFLDNLDRVTAKIIAHNTRKFANRLNTTFILASSKTDITHTLKPDTHVEMNVASHAQIINRQS